MSDSHYHIQRERHIWLEPAQVHIAEASDENGRRGVASVLERGLAARRSLRQERLNAVGRADPVYRDSRRYRVPLTGFQRALAPEGGSGL